MLLQAKPHYTALTGRYWSGTDLALRSRLGQPESHPLVPQSTPVCMLYVYTAVETQYPGIYKQPVY